MTYWRQAGITYLRFSAISSQLVRAALKKEFRTEAPKKSTIKQTLWKDGKPMMMRVGNIPSGKEYKKWEYFHDHLIFPKGADV